MTRSRTALLEEFAAFPDRVAAAARKANAPNAEGEWTPEQVVRHLIAVETEVHEARLLDLAIRDDPRWSWTEPGPWTGEPDLDLNGVLSRFAEIRASTAASFEALDADGWKRAGTHDTFGKIDANGLLQLAVDHDEEHLSGLRSAAT